MIKIEEANIDSLTDVEFERLYDIVIIAYRETEKEVWGENYVRISKDDFKKHISAGEILVARNEEERVVGGVRCFQLRDGIWSFSLLGADFNEKGKGIGRALINAVEERALAQGGHSINIEILRAKDINTEFKTILSNWYQRLGYDYIKALDVYEVYDLPEKWSKLVNPSVFDCFQKKLTP